MKWSQKEKIVLRRALREMKDAASTATVFGFVHPDNGTQCTPSETLISVAHLFASIWNVDIKGIPVAPTPEPNPHRQPRRVLRRKSAI